MNTRFRWVACQLDYLCDCVNDADRRKALSELPPDLPETYCRLLERVNKRPAKVKSLVQMCLQFIAFASPPLTITQLQQAVSVPETPGVFLDSSNLISVDEIARRCSSLIRKSENGEIFEFSHFSVQEFLTDPSLLNSSVMEMYYISKSRSYTLLAMQCLRFLQLKNFERPIEPLEQEAAYLARRDRENPFYAYAAVWWPKFARGHLENPVLLDLANLLFQRHKTSHFLAWSIEFFRDGLDGRIWLNVDIELDARTFEFWVRSILDDCFSPLHLAAALAFPQICQFLLDENSDPNSNSAWGSPLELAIASLGGFRDIDKGSWNADTYLCSSRHEFILWNLDSDTALKDRIETIELLLYAGATMTASWSKPGFNLLDLSFLFATYSFDLSTSTRLISLGTQFSSESFMCFQRCMSTWSQDPCEPNQLLSPVAGRMRDTLQDFLSQIISIPMCSTEIGYKIVSIAIASASFVLSNSALDFGPIDPNSACSEVFLQVKLMSAVLQNDTESLQTYLSNENSDISKKIYPSIHNPDYSCSLLHLAANHKSISASQILLDFGCDLDAQDSKGELPIHLLDDFPTLDLFLKRGANHLALNVRGESIWHEWLIYDDYDISLIKSLLELDQNQTTEALLARTSSGQTPLLKALKCEHKDNITKVLAIIDHCVQRPQFWKNHGPVFAAAARFGSETVVEHLLLAGAQPDPVGHDHFTPLHELGHLATPACAQILKKMYSDAHKLRFQGLTPLERYIQKAIEYHKMVDQELLAVLATPEALSCLNTDGGTVWSFYCKEFLIGSLQWARSLQWLDSVCTRFDSIISSLLRLGALTSYEETKKESGILPLFSALELEVEQTKLTTTGISDELLSTVILES